MRQEMSLPQVFLLAAGTGSSHTASASPELLTAAACRKVAGIKLSLVAVVALAVINI